MFTTILTLWILAGIVCGLYACYAEGLTVGELPLLCVAILFGPCSVFVFINMYIEENKDKVLIKPRREPKDPVKEMEDEDLYI